MTTDQLAEIERLAAAATVTAQGPDEHPLGPYFADWCHANGVTYQIDHAEEWQHAWGCFLAGAQAAAREAVPAMAAEIRRLDAKHGELMRRFANHARGYNNMEEERDEARAEIRRLLAEVEALKDERHSDFYRRGEGP